MFWDRLDHLDTLFSAFPAESENRFFFEILTILGSFGPFWTPKRPREPQNAVGNRPKWAKRGSTGHKNVFWNRLRSFGYHFRSFPAESENRKNFEILTILGHCSPFWALFGRLLDPQIASGAPKCRGEPAKIGQKGVNRP